MNNTLGNSNYNSIVQVMMKRDSSTRDQRNGTRTNLQCNISEEESVLMNKYQKGGNMTMMSGDEDILNCSNTMSPLLSNNGLNNT